MADDLPVKLRVRTLSLKPNTDEDEQTLRQTQEAAVRSCAFAAVQEGLDVERVVIKFRRQLRESSWERYHQGIRSVGCNCARTTDLWEAGYGGAEQALWVAAQEDKMVEQYSQIVRLAGVQSTEDSVQERSALQPGIQPQETAQDSVPPPAFSQGRVRRQTENVKRTERRKQAYSQRRVQRQTDDARRSARCNKAFSRRSAQRQTDDAKRGRRCNQVCMVRQEPLRRVPKEHKSFGQTL